MADLLALQPNLNISLHIVAPAERRDIVLRQIKRPVFSLLKPRPLSETCTYLAYEALHEIMKFRHLNHLSDKILSEYVESGDE